MEEEEEGGEEGEGEEESEGEEEGSEPTLDTTLPETEGKTANSGHVSRNSGRKSALLNKCIHMAVPGRN